MVNLKNKRAEERFWNAHLQSTQKNVALIFCHIFVILHNIHYAKYIISMKIRIINGLNCTFKVLNEIFNRKGNYGLIR